MAFTYDPATVNAATVQMWRQAGLDPQPFNGSNFQNPSAGTMNTASNLQSQQNYYDTTYANSPSVTAPRVGSTDNVQPQNTLQPLSQAVPQWVLDAQAAGSGGGHSTGPPPGSVPIPGQPGAYVTRSGQTWGVGRPEGMDYDTWLKRNQDALKAAIQQQTPAATAYVQHMNANQLPIGYGNPQTETDYLPGIGLNPLGSGYLGSSAGANYFANAGIAPDPATQGLAGTNFAAQLAAQQPPPPSQNTNQPPPPPNGLQGQDYQGTTGYSNNQPQGQQPINLSQQDQQYFNMLAGNYGPDAARQIMGLPAGYLPPSAIQQPGQGTSMQAMILRAAALQQQQQPQQNGPYMVGGYPTGGLDPGPGNQQAPPPQQPPPQQPPPVWRPEPNYENNQGYNQYYNQNQTYSTPANVPQPFSSGGSGAGNPTPSVGTPQTLRWSAAGNNINTGRQGGTNRASIYGGMPGGNNTYTTPGQTSFRYQS
jgi:hypothetical protein